MLKNVYFILLPLLFIEFLCFYLKFLSKFGPRNY